MLSCGCRTNTPRRMCELTNSTHSPHSRVGEIYIKCEYSGKNLCVQPKSVGDRGTSAAKSDTRNKAHASPKMTKTLRTNNDDDPVHGLSWSHNGYPLGVFDVERKANRQVTLHYNTHLSFACRGRGLTQHSTRHTLIRCDILFVWTQKISATK